MIAVNRLFTGGSLEVNDLLCVGLTEFVQSLRQNFEAARRTKRGDLNRGAFLLVFSVRDNFFGLIDFVDRVHDLEPERDRRDRENEKDRENPFWKPKTLFHPETSGKRLRPDTGGDAKFGTAGPRIFREFSIQGFNRLARKLLESRIGAELLLHFAVLERVETDDRHPPMNC